jgi:hypothetical protein
MPTFVVSTMLASCKQGGSTANAVAAFAMVVVVSVMEASISLSAIVSTA